MVYDRPPKDLWTKPLPTRTGTSWTARPSSARWRSRPKVSPNRRSGAVVERDGQVREIPAVEIVLSDDNFSTIMAGVEEGRIAYDNIRNVIYLLVSTGAGALLAIILSVLAGTPLPLLPVQLLWLNLVTNGIQDVALAFEQGEEDVLERRLRPAIRCWPRASSPRSGSTYSPCTSPSCSRS